MTDARNHLRALDRIEPPDVWQRAASQEADTQPPIDEVVTSSPTKRATAAAVAFAVFGAAIFFTIRVFDSAPDGRDRALQGWPPGGAQGVWQKLPDSPLSPRYGALAFWIEGRIVVIGGSDSEPCPPEAFCGGSPGQPLRDGAAFSPSSGKWTSIPPSPTPTAGATGTVLGATIYLWVDQEPAGTSFLSYNVNQDSWQSLPLPPGADLPVSRFLVATNDAVVAYPDSQERGTFPDLLYDPSGRVWRELPSDPLVPSVDRSMVWTGNDLLLFAVEDVRKSDSSPYFYRAAELDIAAGAWRRLPDPDIAGSSPTWFWSAGRAVNPTIGHVGDNGDVIGSGSPYGGMFDPSTSTWSELPGPPKNPQEYGGPSVGGDDQVVSWQGAILDVASGSWSTLPAPPVAADEGAAVVWAGDRLVVWGGFAWEGDAYQDPLNAEATLLNTGWWWRP